MNYKQMTSKEIWDLFNSGKLDPDKLGKEDLDDIFNIELEELEHDEAHDISLMEKCAEILMLKYEDGFVTKKFSIEDIAAIEKDAASGEQKNIVNKKRAIPKRRLAVLVAAAIISVVTLSVVAAASFDFLGEFGITIKDLFNMHGGVISNDNKELHVGKNTKSYKSFDELINAIGFDIFKPSKDSDYNILKMYTTEMPGYNDIYCEISLNDHIVIYSIYYGESAENYYGSESTLIEQSVPSFEWNGYNVYHSIVDGAYQASIYKDSLIYVINSDTEDTVKTFINMLQ